MLNSFDKYDTFGPRFGASLIDGLIFVPLIIINLFVLGANLPLPLLYIWFLVLNLANPFYTVVMHGQYGQTLGKMAMHIKVVDSFENPITFHHAVLRSMPHIIFNSVLLFSSMLQTSKTDSLDYLSISSLAGIVSVLSIFWSIADIVVFFVNDKKRALHDFIAGTVVVRLNP